MPKFIIIISGKKGSGKNTLARQLKAHLKKIYHKDFLKVKEFAYADKFKKHLIDFFGLDPNIVYGTDIEKNTIFTPYKWESMLGNHGKTGFMTYREFMQYWGTEVCRSLDNEIHVKNCFKDIKKLFDKDDKKYELRRVRFSENLYAVYALITDARFGNEVQFNKSDYFDDSVNLIKVRLTRNPNNNVDTHRSEIELDGREDLFDVIVPPDATRNQQLSLVLQELAERMNTGVS